MAVQLLYIVQVLLMWLEASPSVVHVATINYLHVEKQKCKPVVNKSDPLSIQLHRPEHKPAPSLSASLNALSSLSVQVH